MMDPSIAYIYERISALNPLHGKKIKKNLAAADDRFDRLAGSFFNRYTVILERGNLTLDYLVDCYLKMIADVRSETVEFLHSGKYTSSTFAEVNQRVYDQPGIMEYYMHGLILSQFLWKHHYQMFDYFITTLPRYKGIVRSYLEVGVGHGFYLSNALEVLEPGTRTTAVDISKTSIGLAKAFVNDDRVDFHLKDIFGFDGSEKFDFITLGEVLEHVERPLELLLKLKDLLNEEGTLFFTTPTNAPAIDHIYLFHSTEEIRDLVRSAGFYIDSEATFSSEDVSAEKASTFRIALLFGAFLKKTKIND